MTNNFDFLVYLLMANFVDLTQLGVTDGYMGYVEYPKLSGGGKEVLWTHNWDIDIPQKPRAVFWPGLDVIKHRLKTLNIETKKELSANVDINIRGFHIKQAGGYDSDGTISWELIDFEDNVSYGLALSFMSAGGANRYKFQLRKEDVMIPIFIVYFLNSSRIPVRRYDFYTLIFTSADFNEETPSEPQGARETVTLNFEYEHHDKTLMNIVPAFTF